MLAKALAINKNGRNPYSHQLGLCWNRDRGVLKCPVVLYQYHPNSVGEELRII